MTTVVIVGAGPAGLTLANLLHRAGIGAVVLEARERTYIEQRQRAGLLDHRAEQIFEAAGLGEQIIAAAPSEGLMEFRYEGEPRFLNLPELSGGRPGRVVTQQMLVRRLLQAYDGDIRFGVRDVSLHDLESSRPRVTFTDAAGDAQEAVAEFVAGCDGFHGVTRSYIPESAQTTYTYDHGIGWFTILTETPPPRYSLFAVSRHGFAAHFPRGPKASRCYLQYRPGEDPTGWSDEHIWRQLRLRLGDNNLPDGPITERDVVEMRSFVIDPMSYGRLFLVGDAAHIITPMGAKGMNLALFDADVLARALVAARDGDESGLRDYSAVCLRRTWDYQEFSRWITEIVHYAADPTIDPFLRKLAKARFDRLFNSASAGAAFADLMAG